MTFSTSRRTITSPTRHRRRYVVPSGMKISSPVVRNVAPVVSYHTTPVYHEPVISSVASSAAASAVSAHELGTRSSQTLEDKAAFVFNQDTVEKIKHISTEAGISESEVMQRALVLMEVAVNASKSGDALAILDGDESVKTRITGLVN